MFESVRRARLGWRQATAVFGAGVALTMVATSLTGHFAGEASRRSQDVDSLRLSGDLQSVMLGHTALLSALRSLHRVNQPLTRAQFHDFVAGGRLLEQHPGAQALEFARRLQGGATTDGPTVVPVGFGAPGVGPPAAADRWIVDYLEPLQGNEAAFGLDLGAEPTRRAAIEAACADDRPYATPPVRLVQETGSSSGLVVFSPLYDAGVAPPSLSDRMVHCSGLMIVVYRATDMLASVRDHNPTVDFEIYDSGPIAARADDVRPRTEVLLFDSDGSGRASEMGSSRRVGLDFHGRRWLLVVDEPAAPPLAARAVGVIGLAFSLVVAGLVLQLATFRRRALARGRVAAAGDRDRRSLERDLHDGAQQRLLSVSLALHQVQNQVDAGGRAATMLKAASDELSQSLAELRELAQGLHPAVLSDHGLAVAAEGLVARAPVFVDLRVDLSGRLPQPVEVAAYYVLCESLANAAKHARATWMQVTIRQSQRLLSVEVRDDGVGLAGTAGGTGLRGLADRVEALDGRFRVLSTPGRGTCVRAEIPFG